MCSNLQVVTIRFQVSASILDCVKLIEHVEIILFPKEQVSQIVQRTSFVVCPASCSPVSTF